MSTAEQWLHAQTRQGRYLYLVLDSEGQLAERKMLLKELEVSQYNSFYSSTAVSEMASNGPYILQLDTADHSVINTLIQNPERHWGWLASAEKNDLDAITRHWRQRMLTGERPHLALYRFHDNRVLGRALAHLQPAQYCAYLGPIVSVCYWFAQQWTITENPAPGEYSLPPEPAWLTVPTPAATFAGIQFINVHRYLMSVHTDSFSKLAKQQNVNTWLRHQLDLAHAWGWQEPERLHFFLMQCLVAPGFALPSDWSPRPSETPTHHFDRLYHQALYWQGNSAL